MNSWRKDSYSKDGTVNRVVIFTNSLLGVPSVLIKGTLSAISRREDFELAAVCLPERPSSILKMFIYSMLYTTVISIRSFMNQAIKRKHKSLQPVPIYRLARKYRFELIVPPRGNINDPAFIAHLRDKIRPTIALSFYCLTKFSPDLLATFKYAVNYHNSFLPKYRGRNATSWSLYQGESCSGFTFHYMTAEWDAGHILAQENLPVKSDDNLYDLEMEKATKAVDYIPQILQMVSEGANGQPQKGAESYHSWKNCQAMSAIADPSSLSKMELMKRLKSFEKLEIQFSGRWYEVTGIREVRKGPENKEKFTFITSDGFLMKAVHFLYLPSWLYWMYRHIKYLIMKPDK